MKSLSFDCEVITPMFMAGADKDKGIPELRPSEFKGMMRFWWRAVKAVDDINRLKQEEAKIFGGAGENQGKRKFQIMTLKRSLSTNKFKPILHKTFHKTFKFNGFSPGSSFRLVIKSDNEKILRLVKDVFLIATILGGFGKRSRRGFGSIRVLNVSNDVSLQFILDILNKIEPIYFINKNKIANSKKTKANYPWIKEVEIGKPNKDVKSLLRKISQASHDYKDVSLGNANPRMASPVYVSIINVGSNNYAPIITTLNSYFPPRYPKPDFSKQKSFKEAILND